MFSTTYYPLHTPHKQWSISEDDEENDEEEEQCRKSDGGVTDINITVSDYTSVCPVVSGLLDDDDKNSDAAAANVRAHLEDLQELVAELEQTLLEMYEDNVEESLWQLTSAMAAKLDWCCEGVGEMHSSLSERALEMARLGEMVRGKEEQIRRLERERGELLEKVRRLQGEAEALAGLVGAGAGQDGARLAECLREKSEALENLQEEVRRSRRRSIIDDRDELLEKVQ